MNDDDKRISGIVKDLEQSISHYAALVAAREYIATRSRDESFNEAEFIRSLSPHVLSHHITGNPLNMRTINSTLEFAKDYPEAFAALPEAYQNDDVLKYIINSTGTTIIVQPLTEQESVLGVWIAVYDVAAKVWYDVNSGNELEKNSHF